LQRKYIKQGDRDLKAFSKLKRTEFSCKVDAQIALQNFSEKLTLTMISDARITELPHFSKKGRPGKEQVVDQISYHIEGELASRIDIYQRTLERKSTFIVATNEMDEQMLDNEKAIDLYKKDQQKVERGFRFLKDPLFMAASLFLKSTKRIIALTMVMTLCLLVYCAIEYRIRKALEQQEQTFPNQLGKTTVRPTARWVFQFFSGIRLLAVSATNEIVININEHHRALLTLLGERYVALYENST